MCIYFLNSLILSCPHKRSISCSQLAVADRQGEVVEGGGAGDAPLLRTHTSGQLRAS